MALSVRQNARGVVMGGALIAFTTALGALIGYWVLSEKLNDAQPRLWLLAAASAVAGGALMAALSLIRVGPEGERAWQSAFAWLLPVAIVIPNLAAPLLPDWIDVVTMSAVIGFLLVFNVWLALNVLAACVVPPVEEAGVGLTEDQVTRIQAEQRGPGRPSAFRIRRTRARPTRRASPESH